MKGPFLIVLFLVSALWGSAASCKKKENNMNIGSNTENNESDTRSNGKIKIKINSKTFTVTLSDNSTAKAFKEMLPLTINMIELNGNEKYYDLSKNLPARSSNPGTIKSGDLMLYGSKTLVLFYKTFSTSYGYTKIGHIEDTTGLAEALGAEDIIVSFENE